MNIKQEIINYINEKRMSTEEVGDALGKTGLLKDAKPITRGLYSVGEIQYIYAFSNSNWPIHEQIIHLEENKIVFVDKTDITDMALFGQLVSRFILQKKKAKAIVSNGYMRDLQGLLEDHASVWCKDIIPIGCYNVKVTPTKDILELAEKQKDYYEGAIAVCDDSGVVVIPKDKITSDFLEKLKNMHDQEKIWFDLVMDKDWSTYDTVCLKKYLKD